MLRIKIGKKPYLVNADKKVIHRKNKRPGEFTAIIYH